MAIHIYLLLIYITCTANASLDCITTNLDSNLQPLFQAWSKKHVKLYPTLEENARRMDVFKSRLEFMASVNSMNKPYCLGLNHFSDLTDEEFRAKYVGAIQTNYSSDSNETTFRDAITEADSLPEWVDWRSRGAVTYVRNQGECRCCWAFSAVAAVEGLYHIQNGELLALSEQQLLDCMNAGCNPNFVTRAFDYISRNPITAESDYPYRALLGRCQEVTLERKTVTIGSYTRITPGDEYALKAAVAKQPVSVAVEATGLEFRSYAKGIFDGECGTEMDHAVTLVGYGSENGLDYWIIKNSWGEEWGEDGFMRLRRNLGDGAGKCGVAKDASFPTFV